MTLHRSERNAVHKNPVFAKFKPDATLHYSCLLGSMFGCVETLSGMVSYTDILSKVIGFQEWWYSQQTGDWLLDQYRSIGSNTTTPYCRYYILVHSRTPARHLTKLRRVLRAVMEMHTFARKQVFVASVCDLAEPRTLADAVWYAGEDLHNLATDWKHLSDEQKKARITEEFSLLPQHRMFPHP